MYVIVIQSVRSSLCLLLNHYRNHHHHREVKHGLNNKIISRTTTVNMKNVKN